MEASKAPEPLPARPEPLERWDFNLFGGPDDDGLHAAATVHEEADLPASLLREVDHAAGKLWGQ